MLNERGTAVKWGPLERRDLRERPRAGVRSAAAVGRWAAGSNGKTILVTGGAGFVGSHACKALSRAGYLPVTFDNLEHGHERAVKWGPLGRGDQRSEKDLARVFEARRPWAVMHFAAYAYVGESTLDPAKYL
jgi:nucleoside-diphosphate-sugar epimerase